MSEVLIYLLMDILLGIILVPWLMIIAVPILMLTLGLGVGSYVLIAVLSSSQKAKEELRVLLVDDSPNTLMLIKSILKKRNCILKIVDSGLKAVEELSREKYDLMVLDYFMPGLNGSETLNLADHAINEKMSVKPNYQIPVIEYSSCREESIAPTAMNHFTLVGKFSKSMPPSMLKPLIGQILNNVSVCPI